jgi:hypothetical protein
MRPPRDALYSSAASVARVPARVFARRERRAYLLQCDTCKAKSTGYATRGGVLVSEGMQINFGRHRGCGGEISLFDIKDTKDSQDS